MMRLPGESLQLAAGIALRILLRILQRDGVILIAMQNQHRSPVSVRGILRVNHLRRAEIVSAQDAFVRQSDFVRNMLRVEASAEQAALPGALRDHKRGRAQNQPVNPVPFHPGRQRGHQSALGMPGQNQILIPLLQRPVDDRQGVGNPFEKRMLSEGPAAFAVAVQIKPQRRIAGFPHGGRSQEIVGPVLGAGKAVQLDRQAVSVMRFRLLQHGAQRNIIVVNDHPCSLRCHRRPVSARLQGSAPQPLLSGPDAPD